ncbi:MAG: class I SAM-dependent methyltransferase [Rhodomicrobium sp.]
MELEQSVAQHYTHGSLEGAIFGALAALGKDLDHLAPADLAPVDEFHIGGRQATTDFAAELEIEPGLHLLDIGSGLGGASRYFARERRCRVMAIDLTQEYVRAAEALAKRVGLENQVSYQHGSALALPFAPRSFDGAYMLHVGMNIQDKARLFAEVQRVLKPGGIFGIYDVMRESGEGDLSFPVPWASSPDTSFVESAITYRCLLESAGFEVQKERSRREFAVEFFRQMRARATEGGGPPPLGLHILMGTSAPQKVANMIDNLERGLIAPTEIISRAI